MTHNDSGPGESGRGPHYDRVMRSLARAAPRPLCAVFGIRAGDEMEALSESFPSATRVPDQLIRVGPGQLAHIEFARRTTRDLVPRMLIYRGLIMERFPEEHLQQHVVVLGEGTLKSFGDLAGHGFALDLVVTYLREQDPARFLAHPALAPLAAVARGTDDERASALAQALIVINRDARERRSELLEAAGVMATIYLAQAKIDRAVKETGMSIESIATFYEGTELGQALIDRGRSEGRSQGRAALFEALLRERFGDRPQIELLARRLAQHTDEQALQLIHSARSLDDLLG